ncbi:TRAP transporter large permease (plasmid) [Paracoccus versutus]|uniref:TRAP transporter large permease protein n=1 Tax=Paracoccus versutus TaxID=34007 RepID=A0AAQ0HD35_PARVE|nr:TRAP transporter large permease [Paracoccus versutus]KGJ10224.1 C4-dicarboxylate ABC transporter permease [Paracoccus versutus]REG30255.1 tripartite ATP-independent transporter DctM subunit [Paracoccus versutus]WEJ80154.1 TRAP transporter large permease [Paracoccus versutus]
MIWLGPIFVLTLALGMPIAFVLGISALGYFYFTGQTQFLIVLPQRMLAGMDMFVLLAIPLFVLAGAIMDVGGLTRRLIGFANSVVGRFRGGLSLTAVWGCFLFGGVSGSAAADAAAIGTVMVPDMKRQGYDVDYSAALIAVSSLMAPLVPPSIAMIIYGALSGTSISQLLVAGLAPGFMLAVFLSAYAVWVAHRRGYPKAARQSLASILRGCWQSVPVMLLPVIIVVGIRGGIFTATEAAAVAAIYALVIATVVYRAMSWKFLKEAFVATAIITSAIYFLVAVANVAGFIFAIEQLPQKTVALLTGVSDNKYVILLMVNLILLFLGMFLDTIGVLILTVPALMAIGNMLGLEPVHLGVMVVFNVLVGFVTPPVGLCLFVIAGVTGRPMERIAYRALPMIGIALIVLALITVFPEISLFLPRVLGVAG